jgi:hypothetical protein
MTTRIYCSLRWRCTSNQSTILVAGQLAVPLQTGRSYVCKSTQIRHRSSSWLHWLYLMRKVCSEDPVRRRIITLPYLHQMKDGLHSSVTLERWIRAKHVFFVPLCWSRWRGAGNTKGGPSPTPIGKLVRRALRKLSPTGYLLSRHYKTRA